MNVCGSVLGRSQRARPHREDTHRSGFFKVVQEIFSSWWMLEVNHECLWDCLGSLPKSPPSQGGHPLEWIFYSWLCVFERGFDADELSLELEKSLVVRMHTHACS